jgi:hypothetical protein
MVGLLLATLPATRGIGDFVVHAMGLPSSRTVIVPMTATTRAAVTAPLRSMDTFIQPDTQMCTRHTLGAGYDHPPSDSVLFSVACYLPPLPASSRAPYAHLSSIKTPFEEASPPVANKTMFTLDESTKLGVCDIGNVRDFDS